MNQTEALDFIGLKEPLNEETVQNKYKERFNYFQMLYSNAPSKVIEKIQQQNIEKLNQAKKILLDEIRAKKNAFNQKFADPVVLPKPLPMPTEGKPVVGWLIVHTENKKAETFKLQEGINYIGRKKKDDGVNSIVIQDDPYVSRTHAFIKCKPAGGKMRFELYDGDGSKPSANGVFLNGDHKRIKEHCPLAEGDTIQIGTTKLVLKIKKENRSITGELEEVMRTDFIRTINIDR